MNDIVIFNNPEFGEIRTTQINGEPWFVGKDVAMVLGYEKPTDAVRKRVDEEDRGVSKIETPSGTQEMAIINESGLYSLILSSRLPGAKKFKRWVTSEVLPSIRKTGTYKISPEKATIAEAKLNNSRARISAMWLKIAQEVGLPEYRAICASYASSALAGVQVLPLPESGEQLYTATEIGEMFGGVDKAKIGKLANEHGLKSSEYGKMVWDKSPYSAKQVQTWRYNKNAIEMFEKILKH